MKKNILLIVIFFFLGFISYPILFSDTEKSADIPTEIYVNKKTAEETSDSYTFKGEGVQIIGPMNFKNKLVIIHAKNLTGKNDSFSIEVKLDKNGSGKIESGEGWTGVGLSVGYSDAESFDGKIAFKAIPGKDYYINVDGGRWEISAQSLPALSKKALDFSGFASSGIQVSEKFYLPEANITFPVKNKGKGRFTVYLVDEEGNFSAPLINTIGDYEGDLKYKVVFPGNYILVVKGGDWRIGNK